MNLAPILHLKGNVMQLGLGINDEIHRMVIDAAAQEGKEVATEIRRPETEKFVIELHRIDDAFDAIGDVAELHRHDADRSLVVRREFIIRINFKQRALVVVEAQSLLHAGRDAHAALGLDAFLLQFRGELTQIGTRLDLERQARQFARCRPLLQHHGFLAHLGRQHRAFRVTRHQREANDARIIIERPLEVLNRYGGMRQSFHLNHGDGSFLILSVQPPIVWARTFMRSSPNCGRELTRTTSPGFTGPTPLGVPV